MSFRTAPLPQQLPIAPTKEEFIQFCVFGDDPLPDDDPRTLLFPLCLPMEIVKDHLCRTIQEQQTKQQHHDGDEEYGSVMMMAEDISGLMSMDIDKEKNIIDDDDDTGKQQQQEEQGPVFETRSVFLPVHIATHLVCFDLYRTAHFFFLSVFFGNNSHFDVM